MKKDLISSLVITLITGFGQVCFAQAVPTKLEQIHIEDFCAGPTVTIKGQKYVVKEDGFCNAIKEVKAGNELVDADLINDITYTLNHLDPIDSVSGAKCNKFNYPNTSSNNNTALTESLTDKAKTKWKIRFYASHSWTTYYNTDIKMRSSRVNIDVKDMPIGGRDGHHWFNPKTFLAEGNNPAQMIDEPSNTFTIGFIKPSKNGSIEHEFILSAFHPKEIYASDDNGSNPIVQVDGTVDGTEVHGMRQLSKPFDGYNQEAGELEISRNQSTHMNMMYSVGYKARFKLLDGKAGSLVYSPGIQVGIATGKSYSAIIKEGEWWENDAYEESGLNYHGYGGSVTNKIEYLLPSGKFGIHYENKLGMYNKKVGFLDGTQEYTLKFMGNSLGLTFMIHDQSKKKKDKRKYKKKN